MTVKKEGPIQRFIGASTDTKPTSVAIGSTFLEYDTSDTYITYDGTNWNKKKTSFNSVKTVRSIKTLDAAAIYNAGDVVSESPSAAEATTWAFRSVVDGNGGAGVITHAQCFAETVSASGDLILDLYAASPTCALADHAANTSPQVGDITASIYLGRITTTKLAGVVSGGAIAIATPQTASSGLPLPFVCGSATNAIYGVTIVPTALGVAASSDLVWALTIEKR